MKEYCQKVRLQLAIFLYLNFINEKRTIFKSFF